MKITGACGYGENLIEKQGKKCRDDGGKKDTGIGSSASAEQYFIYQRSRWKNIVIHVLGIRIEFFWFFFQGRRWSCLIRWKLLGGWGLRSKMIWGRLRLYYRWVRLRRKGNSFYLLSGIGRGRFLGKIGKLLLHRKIGESFILFGHQDLRISCFSQRFSATPTPICSLLAFKATVGTFHNKNPSPIFL
jgi:hypothetical protein